MAARLRGLTNRYIFCTFAIPRSTQILSRNPPGTIPGTVRFRSVKTKPSLQILKDIRLRNQNALSDTQLRRILEALFERMRPPSLEPGSKAYSHSTFLPDYLTRTSLPPRELIKQFRKFSNEVLIAASSKKVNDQNIETFTTREEIVTAISEPGGLALWLKNQFGDYIEERSTPSVEKFALVNAADLRFPQEWYPLTRQQQRTWYLHVGPTNSGKTYNALKRLKECESGIYAGPLRLLAHEVYERMNAEGIPCNLITGDDRKIVSETANIFSSTVEMVDLNRRVQVAVLDEIQMIGDTERGWAWTQALLGVKADEVHLCGEERTVELIQNLATVMNEKLVVKHYKRLGGLEVMKHSLEGDLMKLERGDCVVTFSRKNIFALQREIESVTGKKCAVIYGSLPPETRSIQAQLFNDPDSDYEILIASDAVGMGLNLSVKRIVFETTVKFNGKETVPVSVPAIKQIAGRAGRFRVANAKVSQPAVIIPPADVSIPLPAAPAPGLVTTLEIRDLAPLKYSMSITPQSIRTAGILPSTGHIEHYAALFPPETELAKILRSIKEHARLTKSLFHLCSFDDHIKVAHALRKIQGLSISERLTFCMAPISSDFMVQEAALEMAQTLASSKDGSVLKMKSFDLDILDIENPTRPEELRRLEGLHKSLLLYLWLSWRFPSTFTPRETAQELKSLCEKLIDLALKNIKIERKVHMLNNHEKVLANTQTAAIEEYEDEDDEENIEDREEEGESVVPNVGEGLGLEGEKEDLGFVPKEWVTPGNNHGEVEIAGR